VQLLSLIFQPNQVVFEKTLDFERPVALATPAAPLQYADPTRTLVTEPFEVGERGGNLDFMLTAPVTNAWFGVTITLVNETTGDTQSFDHGVEYYEGYDADGSWSEGSRKESITLTRIPGGTYHLNLVPVAGSAAAEFTLRVRRGVVTWANFLASLALSAGIPIFMAWRSREFEKDRWSTSDFSPYWSGEDDE
jgi:hypothetical protein